MEERGQLSSFWPEVTLVSGPVHWSTRFSRMTLTTVLTTRYAAAIAIAAMTSLPAMGCQSRASRRARRSSGISLPARRWRSSVS